jgi:nanoRNase/pAp phosphatase (c-di-AMP/oligoRNAs hydrolase)
MELSTQQQIFDQLRKANKVLIALPENLTADALASGLALKLFLQKLQKDVDVVSSGQPADNLRFLPGYDTLKPGISNGKSLVISVDTSLKKLDEISYQAVTDKVSIYLKSQGQPFEEGDVSFSSDRFPVDAIVILDAPSLEHMGRLFEDNAELFYETPKINIDHKASNELYGSVNLVDVTATSVGEILAGLLEQFEAALLDEDIATALLTGIITKTASFQHAHTTPEAFLKASRLIGIGGRQQEIIKHIYKTKSLSLLKLWGRALARLKTVADLSLIYSLLNPGDFEKADAASEQVLPVLKEFLDNVAGFRLAAVLAEQPSGQTRLALAVHLSLPLEPILAALHLPAKPALELPQFKVFVAELPEPSLATAEQYLLQALEPLKSSLAAE